MKFDRYILATLIALAAVATGYALGAGIGIAFAAGLLVGKAFEWLRWKSLMLGADQRLGEQRCPCGAMTRQACYDRTCCYRDGRLSRPA